MKRIFLILVIPVLYFSCTPSVAKIDNSLKKYFDSAGVTGSFAFLNNQLGDITVYNMETDTQRISPGGSFKIAETLIGVETSRLTDTNSTIKTSDSSLAGISLKSAFVNDNQAYLQALANHIGLDTMKHWLDTLHYGNMKITDINSFWQNGELKISPDEQLGLIYKIYFDKLPFQKYAQEIVRELMLREDNTLYKFSYDIGEAGPDNTESHAWMCGWIEENRHVYFFICLVKSGEEGKNLKKIAINITKNILSSKGFFKGER